jgi:hypothetical protein
MVYGYRIVHQLDPVPHIPLKMYGWWQHRYEVWYNNNMTISDRANYMVCDRADDGNLCSNPTFSLIHMKFFDHTHYFNQDVALWGHQGCVTTD